MSTKYVGPKYLKWFYDIDWAGWPLFLGAIGGLFLIFWIVSFFYY